MGGTGQDALRIQTRLTHLPMLLQSRPRAALYLGVASGVTVGAAAHHPGVHADAAELVPEVLNLLHYFEPYNNAPQRDPRMRLFAADARRFVRTSPRLYDVIVGDLFHPAREGVGLLYTREHFEAIRTRLAPGGLFCQWLPLYQLDHQALLVIMRTFLEVFPRASAWQADENEAYPVLGLIGTANGEVDPEGSAERAATRWSEPSLAQALAAAGLRGRDDISRAFVARAEAIALYTADAPNNTDDRPVVVFTAPRFNAFRGRGLTELSRALRELRTLQGAR
jgi:spermidine synthase